MRIPLPFLFPFRFYPVLLSLLFVLYLFYYSCAICAIPLFTFCFVNLLLFDYLSAVSCFISPFSHLFLRLFFPCSLYDLYTFWYVKKWRLADYQRGLQNGEYHVNSWAARNDLHSGNNIIKVWFDINFGVFLSYLHVVLMFGSVVKKHPLHEGSISTDI